MALVSRAIGIALRIPPTPPTQRLEEPVHVKHTQLLTLGDHLVMQFPARVGVW